MLQNRERERGGYDGHDNDAMHGQSMHHRLPLCNPWSSTNSCTLTCPIDSPSPPCYHPSTAATSNQLPGIYSSTWRADQPLSSLHPRQRLPAQCLCPEHASRRPHAPPPPTEANPPPVHLPTRASAPSPPWTGHLLDKATDPLPRPNLVH